MIGIFWTLIWVLTKFTATFYYCSNVSISTIGWKIRLNEHKHCWFIDSSIEIRFFTRQSIPYYHCIEYMYSISINHFEAIFIASQTHFERKLLIELQVTQNNISIWMVKKVEKIKWREKKKSWISSWHKDIKVCSVDLMLRLFMIHTA